MRVTTSLTLLAAVCVGTPARAEQVVLKSGGRVNGILLERTGTHVALQVGPGVVKIPMASVARIVEGRAPLALFAERAERLGPADKSGWLELGMWARDSGLETQARECFARVLALEPQNPIAQAGLGNVMLDGRWVSPEDAYRARGFVRFEGAWMPPEDRDELLRDRAARREELRIRAEERARVEEAEARAREAEAAARAAEAAASGWGVPLGYYDSYGYVVGGSPIVTPPYPGQGPYCPPELRPAPRPRPTRDTGSTRSGSERSGTGSRGGGARIGSERRR